MILATPILILLAAALLTWALRRQLPATVARGWLLALAPLSSFLLLLWQAGRLGEEPATWSANWIAGLNLQAVIYFDALAALFALLVTGIGTLIILYAGYYFAGDDKAARFFTYLFLFMAMMLGLVLAGDVVTLFIFWEGTSITSFLLVAYKTTSADARRGATKALLITGGGGIALLLGLLLLASLAGGTEFATILASGGAVRGSSLYLATLILVATGAFTKSAQTPAHIWLPEAMSAPTPASAFLHSATMVKAGIYLMARLNPALGQTEAWFWLLSIAGLLTMVTGAYLGTKQDDLKALLAYSTISQLGILMMLVGQDTEIAFKALIIGVVAHALYKSALFMGVGIIDHETGTRRLSRLGGLRRAMPLSFGLILVAGLSLAGLPPVFGFLAKETLLASAVHPTLPLLVSYLFVAAIVAAAALKVVLSGLLTVDTFTGPSRDETFAGHEAPVGMLLAPFVPALLSIALGVLPESKAVAEFFGAAAAASFGAPVKVSFALWTGLNVQVTLSALAITLGGLLFWQRRPFIAWQHRLPSWSFNRAYEAGLAAIDRGAWIATRVQGGRLRVYLSVTVLAMLGLVLLLGGLVWPSPAATVNGLNGLRAEFDIIRLLALLAVVGAALATVVIKRDFFAVLALGAAGLGVAVYMAVEPAPDVALVQIVVDILATVILVLAIGRLPRRQREAAQRLNVGVQWRNLLVAVSGGLLVALMAYGALTSRPRPSLVTPFYSENAKPLTGASDIVGAIIVDFRALDTLIEIAVFSLAGLGVYTLLTHAARKHDDHGQAIDEQVPLPARPDAGFGIGGERASVYIRTVTNLLLPVALVIGAIHMLYGHDQPGDGFTAGVIISLAIGLKYVVFGFRETRRRLWWMRPRRFIASGILLVVINGSLAALLNGYFLAPVDYGALIGLPLPAGVKLSSGFLFEVAIALAVFGGVSLMLDTLGRPAVDVRALGQPAADADRPTTSLMTGD
ncbi:MAG: hydrogen gas-evolving membrane-bound hydrogenase subunit E [Candidatus Promineifilaceae bacterium]|nr:hydrogen gas-evolving membrane-bound hydrogenase subunit E [Candidatus Promineifilaceae bacterium]